MFELLQAVYDSVVGALVRDQYYDDLDLDLDDLVDDDRARDEARAIWRSLGAPCGKPHVTPDGPALCDLRSMCIDCQVTIAENDWLRC